MSEQLQVPLPKELDDHQSTDGLAASNGNIQVNDGVDSEKPSYSYAETLSDPMLMREKRSKDSIDDSDISESPSSSEDVVARGKPQEPLRIRSKEEYYEKTHKLSDERANLTDELVRSREGQKLEGIKRDWSDTASEHDTKVAAYSKEIESKLLELGRKQEALDYKDEVRQYNDDLKELHNAAQEQKKASEVQSWKERIGVKSLSDTSEAKAVVDSTTSDPVRPDSVPYKEWLSMSPLQRSLAHDKNVKDGASSVDNLVNDEEREDFDFENLTIDQLTDEMAFARITGNKPHISALAEKMSNALKDELKDNSPEEQSARLNKLNDDREDIEVRLLSQLDELEMTDEQRIFAGKYKDRLKDVQLNQLKELTAQQAKLLGDESLSDDENNEADALLTSNFDKLLDQHALLMSLDDDAKEELKAGIAQSVLDSMGENVVEGDEKKEASKLKNAWTRAGMALAGIKSIPAKGNAWIDAQLAKTEWSPRMKRNVKMIGAAAMAVAAAGGVAAYLKSTGGDTTGLDADLPTPSGSSSGVIDGNPGANVVELAGNAADVAGPAAEQASNAVDIGNFEYPWDWAEAKFGTGKGSENLYRLAQVAQENGHEVEWINKGTNTAQLLIDQKSDVNYVTGVLDTL